MCEDFKQHSFKCCMCNTGMERNYTNTICSIIFSQQNYLTNFLHEINFHEFPYTLRSLGILPTRYLNIFRLLCIFYIIWRFHTFVKFEIPYRVAFPRPSCEAIKQL